MKKIISIALLMILFTALGYSQKNSSAENKSTQAFKVLPDTSELHTIKFFKPADAEKILGHRVFLKDSLLKFLRNGDIMFGFTYKIDQRDSTTNKDELGILGFGMDQRDLAISQQTYGLLKTENAKLFTVNNLDQVGDEAFWITDKKKFVFLLARKGNRIFQFRMDCPMTDAKNNALQSLAKKVISAH